MTLTVYNTLAREKQAFQPLDQVTSGSTSAGPRSTTWPTSATPGPWWSSTYCSDC